jgi:hypothetical protein
MARVKSQEGKQEFMTDSQGRQVPVAMIKEIDILRDQTVRTIAKEAAEMKSGLMDFKNRIRDAIMTFVERSAKEYDVKWGGKKGNISLTSYDGQYKLIIAMNDNLIFNVLLHTGKNRVRQQRRRGFFGLSE